MKILARLNYWLTLIAGGALAVIIVLTVVDVASANFRGRPITGVYDVVEAALVFLVFLGIPETFRTDQNIAVDVADHFVSPAVVSYLRTFGAIAAVGYLAILEWSMLSPALDAWRFGDFKADSGIPFWLIWVPILFGTAVSMVASALVAWKATSAHKTSRSR